jgi:threonine dehydrogenase-like Zn-dependent dehydrogenase
MEGGYDLVFDCVGSPQSLEECMKWTRSKGQVVLLATAGEPPREMTPLWFQELDLLGCFGRASERVDGRQVGTYNLVLELMAAGRLDLQQMLTHTFPLAEYKQAFAAAMNKSRHGAIKVAFDFRETNRH